MKEILKKVYELFWEHRTQYSGNTVSLLLPDVLQLWNQGLPTEIRYHPVAHLATSCPERNMMLSNPVYVRA